MKKLILAVAVVFTLAFTACTKENVAPQTPKLNKLALDKGNLSQADFAGDVDPTAPPATGDKGNLSQADGSGN